MRRKRKIKSKRTQGEVDLQISIVDYLLWQYPHGLFKIDLSGNFRPNATTQKLRCGSTGDKSIAFPDLFIYVARGGWQGLGIEIKVKRSGYTTKANVIKKSEHIASQLDALICLRKAGYYSDFAGGVLEVQGLIDWYMHLVGATKDVWPQGVVTQYVKI